MTSNLNWQQKIGFIRESAFGRTAQGLSPSDAGINLFNDPLFPTINISNADSSLGNGLTIGPNGNFANAGIFQNQIGAGSNLGWVHGRHSFSFGGNFDRTQLNVINKNAEVAQINVSNFYDFVIGAVQPGLNNSVLFNGTSNRYYRSNQNRRLCAR